MINIKQEIYSKLKDVAENVTDAYPNDWKKFPVIVFLEDENKPYEITDNRESKSEISYTVHIWHNRSISDIAVNVDKAFTGVGFKRTMCQDVPDNEQLRHKQMKFKGIVDNETMLVYHKYE